MTMNESCYKCGKTGHFARHCVEETPDGTRPCFNCGERGHIARQCANPRSLPETRACFRCGTHGHISKECPVTGVVTRVSHSMSGCFNCGRPGHLARQCYDAVPYTAGPTSGYPSELPPYGHTYDTTFDGAAHGDDAHHSAGGAFGHDHTGGAMYHGSQQQYYGPMDTMGTAEEHYQRPPPPFHKPSGTRSHYNHHPAPLPPRTCYNCHEPGHIARECVMAPPPMMHTAGGIGVEMVQDHHAELQEHASA